MPQQPDKLKALEKQVELLLRAIKKNSGNLSNAKLGIALGGSAQQWKRYLSPEPSRSPLLDFLITAYKLAIDKGWLQEEVEGTKELCDYLVAEEVVKKKVIKKKVERTVDQLVNNFMESFVSLYAMVGIEAVSIGPEVGLGISMGEFLGRALTRELNKRLPSTFEIEMGTRDIVVADKRTQNVRRINHENIRTDSYTFKRANEFQLTIQLLTGFTNEEGYGGAVKGFNNAVDTYIVELRNRLSEHYNLKAMQEAEARIAAAESTGPTPEDIDGYGIESTPDHKSLKSFGNFKKAKHAAKVLKFVPAKLKPK